MSVNTMSLSNSSTSSIRRNKSPSWVKFALESRSVLEAGMTALSLPILKNAPKGDGHPVMVLPGFLAADFSTKILRSYLQSRNYKAYGWGLGRNLGRHSSPDLGCGDEIIDRLHEIYNKHGRKVSLIGWSLGGVYARELARIHPEMTRSVITMGSPYKGNLAANHATWLFERMSGFSTFQIEKSLSERMSVSPPVPTTSFYSKSDGITAWECCREAVNHNSENIEVVSSHCGMGHHPVVLWAIADRLTQPDGEWKKFEKGRLKRLKW